MLLEIFFSQSLLSLREQWLAEAEFLICQYLLSKKWYKNDHYHTNCLVSTPSYSKPKMMAQMTWFQVFLYCLSSFLVEPLPFLVVWHDSLMCATWTQWGKCRKISFKNFLISVTLFYTWMIGSWYLDIFVYHTPFIFHCIINKFLLGQLVLSVFANQGYGFWKHLVH